MEMLARVGGFRLTPLEEVIDFDAKKNRRLRARHESERLAPTMEMFVRFVKRCTVRMPMVLSLTADPAPGVFAVRLGARLAVDHRDSGHYSIVEAEVFLSHEDLCMKDDEDREEIVFAFLRWALTHELRECFYVDGVRVRDPHPLAGLEVRQA